LDSSQWDTLAACLDNIIHCGAYVNHIQPYSLHKKANVDGKSVNRSLC
jgi:thioester reductase-like protein